MTVTTDSTTMFRSALLSADERYRYDLRRRWGPEPALLVIGLNPSTADAYEDDPTIRRCIGFAKSLRYGALYMGNIFAWRSTDPRVLSQVPDPIGPLNDTHLEQMAREAAGIIVAWGAHEMRPGGPFLARARAVTAALSRIQYPYCFGTTKDGHPKHPLYLAATTPVIRYEIAVRRTG